MKLNSIKKKILLRKRRIDSTFIGDIIQLRYNWYEVKTEIVLNPFNKKCIRATCFMTGMKEPTIKVGTGVLIPIQAKVIVLKNKYPLWRRMIYRLYR